MPAAVPSPWIVILSERRPNETAAFLRIAGFATAVAADLFEAEPYLNRTGPALVLADYPAAWAFEDFAAQLKSKKPDTVVIAMVDLQDVESARAALHAGYDDVCSRSIPPDALLAKIRTRLALGSAV